MAASAVAHATAAAVRSAAEIPPAPPPFIRRIMPARFPSASSRRQRPMHPPQSSQNERVEAPQLAFHAAKSRTVTAKLKAWRHEKPVQDR